MTRSQGLARPCKRHDAASGLPDATPQGGPILAQRSVARRSLYDGIAPSSRLALSQNRLRADAST